MKHYRRILSLAFCALLLMLLPCQTYAAGYTELSAEIPFTFQNDSSVPHTCTSVIEPADGAPVPKQTEAYAESGGVGRFALCFSRPGIYRYRVYQTEKDRNGVIYDDRIYTVTVIVRNTEKGSLAWSMWATLNGKEKTGAIVFINRDRMSGKQPETPLKGSEGTPETGDDSLLELYFAMMAVSALMLVCLIIVRKREKEEGDGI